MEKNTARITLLRGLVDSDGGPAEFARRRSVPSADKPIDPTYVSQVLNGHRSFGERAALNMARRAGLPDNYFDTPITEQPPTAQSNEAAKIISSLPDKDQDEILHWLRVEAARRRHAE